MGRTGETKKGKRSARRSPHVARIAQSPSATHEPSPSRSIGSVVERHGLRVEAAATHLLLCALELVLAFLFSEDGFCRGRHGVFESERSVLSGGRRDRRCGCSEKGRRRRFGCQSRGEVALRKESGCARVVKCCGLIAERGRSLSLSSLFSSRISNTERRDEGWVGEESWKGGQREGKGEDRQLLARKGRGGGEGRARAAWRGERAKGA